MASLNDINTRVVKLESMKNFPSLGQQTAITGENKLLAGISMCEAYNNGYPSNYGNILNMSDNRGGGTQLLVEWCGINDKIGGLFFRNKRDSAGANWSAWSRCWTQGEVITNACWNDYAEFYPKGEETEPGDIIMLDINSKEEKYIKATEGSTTVVGVHSDSYGHLIGGDEVPDGREFVEYNSKKYIPVGLVGRVYCKVIGKINKGDRIVVSEIAGVGRKFDAEKDNVFQIVGMAVENKESLQIDKIKVHFRAGGGRKLPLFKSFRTSEFFGGEKWLV